MRIPGDVARIEFINPTVYVYEKRNGNVMDGLCEEFLPRFVKWTDNQGGVKFEAATQQTAHYTATRHGGDEKHDDGMQDEPLSSRLSALMLDENQDDSQRVHQQSAATDEQRLLLSRVLDEDILLAFSHWNPRLHETTNACVRPTRCKSHESGTNDVQAH